LNQDAETTDNFLTASELKFFLSSAKQLENNTNYTLILLLAFTGLRKGEAYGLKWENIDFGGKTLTVERTRDNKGVRSPKTKRSYRIILIDDVLINQLKTYLIWCKEVKLSFGMHLFDDDYIFISHQSGTAITGNTLKYCFDRLAIRSGSKRVTPHGLRHSHATILISQRIPVKVIADRLGNTPQMILDIYRHSFKDLEEESVQALNRS
jgi:integrase